MSVSAVEEPPEPGSAAWWLDRQARQARRRPRADGLSVARIIDAALAVIDGEGLDALTVRRLAEHLGTGSASLYRHVASRDELLVLLVDHVIGDVVPASPDLGGRQKVAWLATELRRVLMAHPNLVPALSASPLLGPNARQGTEQALAHLLEAGYPIAVAVPAYLALIDYVLGTVFFDTSSSGRARRLDPGLDVLVPALPAEGWVAELAAAATVDVPAVDEVFRFGLTTFLDGLDRREGGPG